MNPRIKQTSALVFIIIIVMIVIGVAIPMVIYSNSYSEVPGIDAWTPLSTGTPTQELVTSSTSPPLHMPSPTISSSPVADTNCVYPLAYWIENPEYWLDMLVGDIMYSVDNIKEVLENPSTEVYDNLLRQLLLANLNIFSGADPSSIDDVLIEAHDWFKNNAPEEQLTENEHRVAIQLMETLKNFNDGFVEPGICSDYKTPIPTEASTTITPTASPTATSTATRYLVTLRPSETPTSTKKSDTDPDPTSTPKPTNKPATNTPAPQPTSTDAPQPTEKPTSAPPDDTPVPTDPPAPTDPPEKPTPTPVP